MLVCHERLRRFCLCQVSRTFGFCRRKIAVVLICFLGGRYFDHLWLSGLLVVAFDWSVGSSFPSVGAFWLFSGKDCCCVALFSGCLVAVLTISGCLVCWLSHLTPRSEALSPRLVRCVLLFLVDSLLWRPHSFSAAEQLGTNRPGNAPLIYARKEKQQTEEDLKTWK